MHVLVKQTETLQIRSLDSIARGWLDGRWSVLPSLAKLTRTRIRPAGPARDTHLKTTPKRFSSRSSTHSVKLQTTPVVEWFVPKQGGEGRLFGTS